MKYRWLGSSGLLVSRISLGTMTFGTDNWGCGEKESHAIMRAYVDAGGNFIDCADVYAAGRSEEIIGSFLPQVNRDELVVASKCYFPMGQKPNQYGVSRKHVVASCDASLKRLQTDHIDLYYIHGPDPVTPFEETLRAYDDLVRQGKLHSTSSAPRVSRRARNCLSRSRRNPFNGDVRPSRVRKSRQLKP